jgi:hypothetical protein
LLNISTLTNVFYGAILIIRNNNMTLETVTPQNFEQLHAPELYPVGKRDPLWGEEEEAWRREANLEVGLDIEVPNQDLINWLKEADSRVHYFATPNIEDARRASWGMSYYRAIADHIGWKVAEDFQNERVAVRGVAVALTKRFASREGPRGMESTGTVLDVLQLGSDSGKDSVRVGVIEPEGTLNTEPHQWLGSEYASLISELQGEQRDQVFPALLVYKSRAFEGGDFQPGVNNLTGPREGRLAAIYITDRIARRLW